MAYGTLGVSAKGRPRPQEHNDKTLEKLEVELCQHKLNSIKEKARTCAAHPPFQCRNFIAPHVEKCMSFWSYRDVPQRQGREPPPSINTDSLVT